MMSIDTNISEKSISIKDIDFNNLDQNVKIVVPELTTEQLRQFKIGAPSRPKFCYNLIVKNESHVILRCLTLALPMLDAIVIVDTGSSDNTIEIIKSFAIKHNLPYTVYVDMWQDDFAYSRNVAVTQALKFLRDLEGIVIKTHTDAEYKTIKEKNQWYLLFNDADNEILNPNMFEILSRACIKGERISCTMKMKDVPNIYAYNYACRIDLLGELIPYWKGIFHENVEFISGNSLVYQHIADLEIISGRDGSRNKDPLRYNRDALMMEYAINKNPYNERHYYYYGQALICAGRYYDAVKMLIPYILRNKGHVDEIYMSLLACAELEKRDHVNLREIYNDYISKNKNTNKNTISLRTYVECYHLAFNLIPARKEAPYHIACYHLSRKEFLSAAGILKCALVAGSQTSNSVIPHMFVDKDIETKFYEISLELMTRANDIEGINLSKMIL